MLRARYRSFSGILLLLLTAFWSSCPLVGAQAVAVQESSFAKPETVGMSSERLGRLERVLEEYVEQGTLPGGTVFVARRGQVVLNRGFGYRDLEIQDPMNSDDIFRIASQSKALVSTAILLLQEQGKLLISDRLSKHIPAFEETRVAIPDGEKTYRVVDAERPITLRHLLTHTSGYGYGGGLAADLWKEAGIQGWYFADREEPIRTTVDRMAALPAEAQPGERYVYGYSTDILGAVVEAVAGVSLDEFLRTHLFEPLEMKDTHFYLPLEKRDRLAKVYSSTAEGLQPAPDPGHMVGQGAYINGPRMSYSGGAGLLSTAADYGRFLQMMQNEGRYGGEQILAPSTVELMTVNHIGDKFPTPGAGFGLGFEVILDLGAYGQMTSPGAFGWGGAYHSVYWVDPEEELVVVYLTQVIPAGPVDDHGRLRALVYSAILD